MADLAGASCATTRRSKISAFNCEFDPLTKSEAVSTILSWMRESAVCRYVVTPNVHHLVLLQKPSSLRRSYRNASLTLVDGRPVTWALKLLHEPVPEVVPGSDLVPALFDAATPERRLNVFLLGAAPGVAEQAKDVIHERWRHVRIVGAYGPPQSFENDEAETKHILDIVREASPDLLVIGLGCPKQELWICRFAKQVDAKVAICAGATIDFIAGHRQRAPLWVQQIGCEWLFRALQEPRRMGRRYLRDVWAFPAMIVRELWKRRQAAKARGYVRADYDFSDWPVEDQLEAREAAAAVLAPSSVDEQGDGSPHSEDEAKVLDQLPRHRRALVQLASVGTGERTFGKRARDRAAQTAQWDKFGEAKARVLLTGHEGYIGSVLAPSLIDAGYHVVGLDSRLFVECALSQQATVVSTINKDIRDITPSDLEGFYAVVHLAALPNDPMGQLEPELTYEINLKASIQLADYAKSAGVSRFLFSSSSSVFDATGDISLDEASALTPITPFGVAKMWAERDIGRMADNDFCPTFLRIGQAYGLAPQMRLDLLVNHLVATAYTSGHAVVEGDGSHWRSVTHVQDIARAFLAALRAPRHLVQNEAFNVGRSEENYRTREIADVIAEAVPNCSVNFVRLAGAETQQYRVDCGKIARVLPDFRPEWTLRRGVAELYQGYQAASLSTQELEGDRFRRIRFLQSLVESRRIDGDLRWRDNFRDELLSAAG